MAFPDKTGKMHHSASRASLQDSLNSKDQRQPTKPDLIGQHTSHGAAGASKDVSHMDIKDVVKQHGPAHEVHVKHDHEAGAHHVTSHHKGAHHKSTHGSADEAHDHGAMAAGGGAATPDQEEAEAQPFAGTESPEEEQAEEQQGIPGLNA